MIIYQLYTQSAALVVVSMWPIKKYECISHKLNHWIHLVFIFSKWQEPFYFFFCCVLFFDYSIHFYQFFYWLYGNICLWPLSIWNCRKCTCSMIVRMCCKFNVDILGTKVFVLNRPNELRRTTQINRNKNIKRLKW